MITNICLNHLLIWGIFFAKYKIQNETVRQQNQNEGVFHTRHSLVSGSHSSWQSITTLSGVSMDTWKMYFKTKK